MIPLASCISSLNFLISSINLTDFMQLMHPISLTWSPMEFSSWLCFMNSLPWLKNHSSPKCFPFKIVNSSMLFYNLNFISFHIYHFIPTEPDFKYVRIFLTLLAQPWVWFLFHHVQILWLFTSIHSSLTTSSPFTFHLAIFGPNSTT